MKKVLIPLCLTLLVLGCKKNEPNPRIEGLDFSKPAAVGGNFLNGVQDGAVTDRGQEHNIPTLIFNKIREYDGGSYTAVQLGVDEGVGIHLKPWEGLYQEKLILGNRTDCNGEVSLGPVRTLHDPLLANVFQNQSYSSVQDFTVPYMTSMDLNNPAFGIDNKTNLFYHQKASDPGVSSVLSDYDDYDATFTLIQLGMEDIYNYAISGADNENPPDVDSFEVALDQLLQVASQNDGEGVLVNIPSIDYFPFFNLIPLKGGDLRQGQADSLNTLFAGIGAPHIQYGLGENNFIINDPAYPAGARQITDDERILLNVPLDSIKCYLYGIVLPPINERYVLDSSELAIIDQAIFEYNAIIQQKADEYGFAHSDINSYFANVESGIKFNGADFDLQFVTGGFLSLDGLHPNEKGYALLADEIIKAINNQYSTRIPYVNCLDCNGVLFP